MTTRILTLDWLPTPYTRAPLAARWSAKSKRYYASANRLIAEMRAAWSPLPMDRRYRIGVAVFLDPVKSGPNKGQLPQTGGDWDNYFKGVADAMVRGGILDRDDGSRVAGPCDVSIYLISGVFARDVAAPWIRCMITIKETE